MAKKSEIIGEFIVTIEDSESVSVSRIYKSTKKALTEIWEANGMGDVPKTWNTQDLGRHILNDICGGAKEATIGEYTLEREANQRVNVIRTYSVTKKGLTECADSIGFQYDKDWTTRQFGQKLIAFYQTLPSDKK